MKENIKNPLREEELKQISGGLCCPDLDDNASSGAVKPSQESYGITSPLPPHSLDEKKI